MKIVLAPGGPLYRRLPGLLFLTVGLLCAAPLPLRAQATLQKQADGAYHVAAPSYTAQIDANGLLAGLQVGGAECLRGLMLLGQGEPFRLQPAAWQAVRMEQPAPDTLEADLALPGAAPAFTLTYRAEPDTLHLTVRRLSAGYGSVAWPLGSDVVAVEDLKRPGFGQHRLPGKGLVYAVPTLKAIGALRDMRWYLANGRALDVYYAGNDAPFNRQSNGSLRNAVWGRALISKDRPIEFVFEVARAGQPKPRGVNTPPPLRPLSARLARGLAYQLVSVPEGGLFPAGEAPRFQLQFPPRTPITGTYTLTYRLTDFWNREAGSGRVSLRGSDVRADRFEFPIKPLSGGWYHLIVDVQPAGATDTLPNQDDADVGIFTPTNGLVSPPVPLDSTAALSAALGLRCVRETVVMRQWFPTREKSPLEDPQFDWSKLDAMFDRIAADRQQWGVTVFCQLQSRPAWADPDSYQELVRRFVSRYRDRNHVWEIENEPDPRRLETYTTETLAPAYRGAHAADPSAVVLGPALVRVNPKDFDRFFQAGGGAFVDAVSTHSYTGHQRSWEENGNAELLRQLRALMDANGQQNKAIWQTEQGWRWDNHAEMPLLQAAYLVRMFALAASVGIPNAHNNYYYLKFRGFEPWYLFDQEPNRGGMAARIMAEQTAGMRFDREIPMGKFAHAIAYTNGSQDTVVVWTDDFKAEARFRVQGETARVRVNDIMGGPVAAELSADGELTLPLSGFPLYVHLRHGTELRPLDRFPAGTNWALASNGGVAQASSYERSPEAAANLNDGTWHFNEGQADERIWIAAKGARLPQWAQVTFDRPRRIDTVAAVTPSANVQLPGARDYEIQVETNGGWKTVRSVKDNTLEWVLYAHFPPVLATRVRLVITDLNNGMLREDKTPYTDMRPRVYELEAYGP
ncbi:MAG TPA: discoidin domain-containing protein [Chthonomonadaceae bacterium]|nr:discoidin domain-containing protein [Chthonomonadaceae bacterium]